MSCLTTACSRRRLASLLMARVRQGETVVSFDDSAKLEAIFGCWPAFHDAEVLRVILDRSGPAGPTLDMVIHVFEMTKDVDANGFFMLRNHTEVTLRFDGVGELKLEAFNRQNVLAGLVISRLGQPGGVRFRVSMPSSYGMEAEFECARASVVDVRAFTPPA